MITNKGSGEMWRHSAYISNDRKKCNLQRAGYQNLDVKDDTKVKHENIRRQPGLNCNRGHVGRVQVRHNLNAELICFRMWKRLWCQWADVLLRGQKDAQHRQCNFSYSKQQCRLQKCEVQWSLDQETAGSGVGTVSVGNLATSSHL